MSRSIEGIARFALKTSSAGAVEQGWERVLRKHVERKGERRAVREKESGEKKGKFNAKSQPLGVAHCFFSSFFVCATCGVLVP